MQIMLSESCKVTTIEAYLRTVMKIHAKFHEYVVS